MSAALLTLTVMLSTPVACPPELGHIRWDGVEAAAAGLDVRGTLWDRDRDGKASRGDVMRIDEARRGPSPLTLDQTWIVLKGELAGDIDRGLKRSLARKQVHMACETPFELKGVPAFTSGPALARHLQRQDPGAPAPVSAADAARAEMQGWAQSLCRSKRSISKDDLARRLETHAAREQKHIERGVRQRMAREVAAEYAAACTKLALPDGLTFD